MDMSVTAPANAPSTTGAEKVRRIVVWLLSTWIFYIFVWYLQYKFTGSYGSVYLFTILTDWLGFHGYEKVMRIGTGSTELVAAIMLFAPRLPRVQVLGAALSLAIMTGAIFFHLVSPLGIDPYGDGAVLFKEACATWAAAAAILAIRYREVIEWLAWAANWSVCESVHERESRREMLQLPLSEERERMYPLAETILWIAAIYLLAGAIVALAFAAIGVGRVLPNAGHITLGARLASLPGSALLWPVVVNLWRKST
jgi:hypothetical protein